MQADLESVNKQLQEKLSDSLQDAQAGRYDPNQCPPSLTLARGHGSANLVTSQKSRGSKACVICQCCNRPVEREKIPLMCHPKDTSHLGACFPMYFAFGKFCALLLLISFLTSGVYGLYTNYNGTYCEKNLNLKTDFVCSTSINNKLNDPLLLESQSCTNFMGIMMMLIAIEYFRRSQRIISRDCNHNILQPSQYSLMISNLPKTTTKAEVEAFLRERTPLGNELDIRNIYMISSLDNYLKKVTQRQQVSVLSPGDPEQSRRLQELDQEIQSFEDSFKKGEMPDFCGKALVTLEHMDQAKGIRVHFRLNKIQKLFLYLQPDRSPKFLHIDHLLYQGRYLKVVKAPDPSDILWMDIGASNTEKRRQRLWTYLVSSALLIAVLWVLVLFKKTCKQIQQDNTSNPIVSASLSLSAAAVIAVTNCAMGLVLRILARKQRHSTKTTFFIFVGKSLSTLYFLNLAMITLLANFLTSVGKLRMGQLSLSGLLYDAFFIFMTNPFFAACFSFFDIWHGLILLKRLKVQKKPEELNKLTQSQTNTIYENQACDLALRYANIIKTMHFAAFYGAFIPLGFAVSILGIYANYWADKYLLLRRWISPHKINRNLGKKMVAVLERYVVYFAMANILQYMLPIYAGVARPVQPYFLSFSFFMTVLSFMVSLVYHLLLPKWRINKGIFNVRDRVSSKTYEEAMEQFEDSYEMVNPITRGEVLRDYKNRKIFEGAREMRSRTSSIVEFNMSEMHSRSGSVTDIKFNG